MRGLVASRGHRHQPPPIRVTIDLSSRLRPTPSRGVLPFAFIGVAVVIADGNQWTLPESPEAIWPLDLLAGIDAWPRSSSTSIKRGAFGLGAPIKYKANAPHDATP